MSGLDPNSGGALVVPGGGALPTASGAGQLPVSDGGGTAYTATDRATVVQAALSDAPAAARTAMGAETALPRLAVASALHHWRCDESASPFADLGSSPVDLAYVAGTREYARAGVYARYGCTLQRSPAATNRVEAVVSDIPSATDLTFGVTVANETLGASLPGLAVIAALTNGLGSGSDYGVYLLTDAVAYVYASVHHAGVTADSSRIQVDWSRPHRFEVPYATATRVATLYIDGVAATTATPASGTMAALTHCTAGGLATAFAGVGGSKLMMADFTVHLSALSASTLLSRADACCRLAGG